MSRARDLANLGGSADAGGLTGRNLIINGAMTISQRGDSTGVTSTGYYGPDRYQLTLSSLGTWSISQSSTAPSGFGNSYKLEATTNDASPAASDYAIFLQKFEGQNLQQLKKGTASAESVTLSFWVRSSKTGTYIVELFDNDNSRSISASYTISVADTFEYKTITFSGDTTGAFDDDNASSLELIWWLAAGTDFTSGTLNTSWGTRTNTNIAVGQVNMADAANATWYITGVQLEVGETATPFEHEDYGTTLRKCHRYCYAQARYGDGNIANGDANGSTRIHSASYNAGAGTKTGFITIPYPTIMRSNPDLTYTELNGAVSTDYSNAGHAHLYDNDDDAWVIYDFIAEAEL
jgi:hypothetical protein